MIGHDHHLAHLIEARRLSEIGDRTGAERAVRQALALRPDDPMTLAMAALVLNDIPERLDEAAKLAARAIALDPDDLHLRRLAATTALKSARFDDAVALASDILEREPGDRRALHDLALAKNALGDAQAAAGIIDYRGIVHIRGEDSGHHDAIADATIAAIDATGGSTPATMAGGTRLDDAFAIAAEPARQLRAILESAVARHRGGRIAQAWANVMRQGDFERSHIHEQALLSGVYYPRVVQDRSAPDEGALVFGLHHFGDVVPPLPQMAVCPGKGDIMIFPSHFPHGTRPFSGDGLRVSIAFDIVGPLAR